MMTLYSSTLWTSLLLLLSIYQINAFIPRFHIGSPTSTPVVRSSSRDRSSCIPAIPHFQAAKSNHEERRNVIVDVDEDVDVLVDTITTRQSFLKKALLSTATSVTTITAMSALPQKAMSKCADIESCREIGERKVEQDMIDNPTVRLTSGARYKVLQPGIGIDDGDKNNVVQPDSKIDLIFSISTLSGGYMYSRGFGFEKIDVGDNVLRSDIGLDSLRVQLGQSNGQRDVPLGIEDALVGMKRGERRRVELPPRVGFETSEWKPEPTTKRGKARIVGYRQILEGNGSTRPPFPAATIWDIEVLRVRK